MLYMVRLPSTFLMTPSPQFSLVDPRYAIKQPNTSYIATGGYRDTKDTTDQPRSSHMAKECLEALFMQTHLRSANALLYG
jgi:hypothetical protein